MFVLVCKSFIAVFFTVLLETKCVDAEEISTSNEVTVSNSLPVFFEFGNVGLSNFAPKRLGNLGSNYPSRSPFSPFGNQDPDFLKPRSNHGFNNKIHFLGKTQVLNENLPQINFSSKDGSNIRPERNGVFNSFPYDGNRNKNDHVSTRLGDKTHNRGQVYNQNLKFQTAELYSGFKQHPTQNSRNFQNNYRTPISQENLSTRAEIPEDSFNYPIPKIEFPRNGFIRDKHYSPENKANLRIEYLDLDQPFATQPIVSSQYHGVQSQGLNRPFVNQKPGSTNGDRWSNQPAYSDSDNKVAILGKPVVVPPEATTSSNHYSDESTTEAVQKQCVQDCETTSQYDPVCGSDDITYINPGKFECARRCGIDVYVVMKGRCE